jgi:hypothetical protein
MSDIEWFDNRPFSEESSFMKLQKLPHVGTHIIRKVKRRKISLYGGAKELKEVM